MFKERLKGFFAGAVVSALIAGSIGVVWAKQGTAMMEVIYQNVKLYVDGVLITPKDVNGNIVEPFISNGTTYLPVRALSEALGKNVRWDGSTSSVIVGLMPGEVLYFDDVVKPYKIDGDNNYWQADISKGNFITIAGVKYYHGVTNNVRYMMDNTSIGTGYYNLNAKYSQLSGMYGPSDIDRAENDLKISFYGDNRLIKTLDFKKSDMPKDFSVDLTGVLQLRIVITGCGASLVNWQIK